MSYQQEKFKEIADVIRRWHGHNDKIIPNEFPDKINDAFADVSQIWYTNGLIAGEAQGKQTQKDEFWEQFQSQQVKDGKQDYRQAFCNKRFNDSTYDPPLPIIASGLYQGFAQSLLTNTKVPIIANCTLEDCFRWCNKLVTIVELNVGENTKFLNTFFRCDALENIVMTGVLATDISFSDSSKLTSASVDSIIDCMKALQENETAKTLTVHATVEKNMTNAQKAAIDAKGWDLVW